MDKLQFIGNGQGIEFFLDKVLDRFNVVVRSGFNRLDPQRIRFRKVLVQTPQRGKQCGIDIRQLRHGPLAKGNKILDFDTNPVADQTKFRKVRSQIDYLPPITTIDGRNGRQRR